MRSALVAPPERFSRSRNLAVLLPRRLLVVFPRDLADFAALLAFFTKPACLADFALDGATWRACAPPRGRLAGVGSTGGVLASLLEAFSGTSFILISPLVVITATMTSVTLVPLDCKRILRETCIPHELANKTGSAAGSGRTVADVRTRSKIRPKDGAGGCRTALPQKHLGCCA